MFKVGDMVQVVDINPSDLPSEYYEGFIGRVGEIEEIHYYQTSGKISSFWIQFDNGDSEVFYPSSDTIELVEQRTPDWRV